jgi:hypothetical protein
MPPKPSLDNQFTVDATWDDDAEVWVAESGEIPGLITEAESRVKLNKKLSGLVPELLELNGCKFDPAKPIDLLIRYNRPAEKREERIRLPKAA